ncbi:unnamed protein product [Clavelina lepadiformis]|uniref:Vesicle transport v-SNARE N-terminal domain-containing protein n=1 Tax=Clavelina lepadiformis TaxID=159417 RepID=A0ABP0FLH2_CLALP
MASSEIYEDIKENLRNTLSHLKASIKQNSLRKLGGEERQKCAQEIARKSSQAHILIKDLENEIYQAPVTYQAEMNREVKRLKYDLETIERSMEVTKSKQVPYSKQVTFGKGSSSQSQDVSDQTSLMLGHKSLQRASASITRSTVVAAESEGIGNEILDNLGQQREQLHRTRDRLEDTDVELTKTRKLLLSINRKVITNKIFLVFIVFVELGILGGVVYIKFFGPK